MVLFCKWPGDDGYSYLPKRWAQHPSISIFELWLNTFFQEDFSGGNIILIYAVPINYSYDFIWYLNFDALALLHSFIKVGALCLKCYPCLIQFG